MAAVAVADVTAEGGDLNCVVRLVSERDQHDSELRAHRVGFGKDLHDLVGRGVGGNVVIGGFDTEQKVADAAAYEVSLMAIFAQSTNNLLGESSGLRHSAYTKVALRATGQPSAAVPT